MAAPHAMCPPLKLCHDLVGPFIGWGCPYLGAGGGVGVTVIECTPGWDSEVLGFPEAWPQGSGEMWPGSFH